MLRTLLLALILAVVAPAVTPTITSDTAGAAQAAELKFKIRSKYRYQVHLEFYSQDRNHFWPGSGKVYVLKDSKYHTYKLACRIGETICYGAWVTTNDSIYWGVGRNDSRGCEACCRTCGGNYRDSITLRDN